MNEGKRCDVSGLVCGKVSDDKSTGRLLQQQHIEVVWREPYLHAQRKGQWKRDGK